MAKLNVMSIRDLAAGCYNRPIFMPIGLAVRGFTNEVNRADKDNAMFTNAADFDLFELGTFDEETATMEMLTTPRLIVNGKSVQESY